MGEIEEERRLVISRKLRFPVRTEPDRNKAWGQIEKATEQNPKARSGDDELHPYLSGSEAVGSILFGSGKVPSIYVGIARCLGIAGKVAELNLPQLEFIRFERGKRPDGLPVTLHSAALRYGSGDDLGQFVA